MKKRRVFDIDFPAETPLPKETPALETESRRGPMATAISENVDALRTRTTAEQAIREENDRLAHEHVRLKKQGLITDLIPLDAIRFSKLTRDRRTDRDPELDELKESIRSIGLSNPIRVEATADGYELVQGYRRFSAFRELYEETGDPAFAKIPAGLIATGEALENLYRRMVDENLVRKDISFGEMAQLALNYAQDAATDCETVEDAVAKLYASAGRQKRSYIRHFATLLSEIGKHVKFPEAIPRALGLQLEKRVSSEPGVAAKIQSALAASMATTPEKELEILRAHADMKRDQSAKDASSGAAKTTLRLTVPAGTVRCAARNGKVELAMERDFSDVDRHRLEQAVAAFFAALDD
jgi:ParB family chromosome partitioning protein